MRPRSRARVAPQPGRSSVSWARRALWRSDTSYPQTLGEITSSPRLGRYGRGPPSSQSFGDLRHALGVIGAPARQHPDLIAIAPRKQVSFGAPQLVVVVELILEVLRRPSIGRGLIIEHVHLARVLVDDSVARHFLGALS